MVTYIKTVEYISCALEFDMLHSRRTLLEAKNTRDEKNI